MTERFSAAMLAALLDDRRPTEQQAAAIEAPAEPLLIVAGAGSGKTTTMAARVVWLIANGLARPDQILGLTFTRKAAGELARKIRRQLHRLAGHPRLDTTLSRLGGEPTVSTYHSYAAGIITEHGIRAGIEPGGSVLSPARAWQFAHQAVTTYDGDMSAVGQGVDTVVGKVLSLSDDLSEHLCEPATLRDYTQDLITELTDRIDRRTRDTEDILRALRTRLQLLPLVEEYRRRKSDAAVVDYADQLALAARVARDAPEAGRVERQRYPIVLLDEYQDTSHSQVDLLRALFGDGHPVTAVGDPCQSIYAWRGASAGTLSRFPADFPRADGEPAATVALTTSWRNRAEILTVANAVSEPLRRTGPTVTALQPGVDGTGEVTAALLPTVVDEAAWVADRIAAAWRDAPQPPTSAVLVRRRSQMARLESALRERGLPVEVVGTGGLLDAPEVREVHAVLTVLARPTSGPALLRLLTGARWRIGPRDLAALHRRALDLAPQRRGFEPKADGLDEVTLAEALDDPGDAELYSPAAVDRFRRLREELARLRSRTDQSIADLIADIAAVTGLDVEIAVHQGGSERLDAFIEIASQYSSSAAMPTLDGFLSYLDAADERERGLDLAGTTEHSGAVQIMTVHAAKGLEWDLVAVPGLCADSFPGKPTENWLKPSGTGRLPHPLRGDAAELPQFTISEVTTSAELGKAVRRFGADLKAHHETEERRLAYVALTRARRIALVTGFWWEDGGSVKPRGPSDFLTEMCDAGADVAVWSDRPTGSNPLAEDRPRAVWPIAAPLGSEQDSVAAAAVAVRQSDGQPPTTDRANRWWSEANMLLAERDEAATRTVPVPVPRRMSVSQLVAWHADDQAFAARLRRPVPEPPAPHSRRGTAFHTWLEERFGTQALFDLDDLPGAADDDLDDTADDRLFQELCDAFEAGDYAGRTPIAVEVPFVTVLRSVVVRGRMDAVFTEPNGHFEVVDWKTGRPPRGPAARAAAVQLAAYRQAWAALRGVPVDTVTAAFHYVRYNLTVRPADLPDLAGLAAPLPGTD